jgi:hypothetical protein
MNILSKASGVALVIAGCLGIYVTGCSDSSTGPTTVSSKAYEFYFVTGAEEYLYYRYNTGTMDLESFTLPYSNREGGFCISPNGNSMYLNCEDQLVKLSLESMMAEYEQPISAGGQELVISPDEKYLAFLHPDLYLVDLTDFSIVYSDNQDTTSYRNGRFSKGGEVFVCTAGGPNEGYVLEIDLDHGFAIDRYHFGRDWPRLAIPDVANQKLYLSASNAFLVYDLIGDSALYSRNAYPVISDMEITPDGHSVVYCQPGSIMGPYPMPGADHFTIIDCLKNEMEREVDVITNIGYPIPPWPIYELCISPDGRHMVGLSLDEGQLFDYDLKANRFNRLIYFAGYWTSPRSLTCQARR